MPQLNMAINDVPTDEQTDSCLYIVYWKTTFVIYLFICQFENKNTFLASQRHSVWQPHFYSFNIFPIRPIISRERQREREKHQIIYLLFVLCNNFVINIFLLTVLKVVCHHRSSHLIYCAFLWFSKWRNWPDKQTNEQLCICSSPQGYL